MLSTIFISIFIFWIGIMVLVWLRGGLNKGRRIGNKVAAHIGIKNNLFHSILDNGVSGPTLPMLAALDNAYFSIDKISVLLAPSLVRGISVLEQRFGPQPQLENAKLIISPLINRWEKECTKEE